MSVCVGRRGVKGEWKKAPLIVLLIGGNLID
jgi:hypothetical protein